jgi:hypothetical protein
MAQIQMPGDRDVENAVAEKLQPLVGARPGLGPVRMREDLLGSGRRQFVDQAAERVGGVLAAATGAT